MGVSHETSAALLLLLLLLTWSSEQKHHFGPSLTNFPVFFLLGSIQASCSSPPQGGLQNPEEMHECRASSKHESQKRKKAAFKISLEICLKGLLEFHLPWKIISSSCNMVHHLTSCTFESIACFSQIYAVFQFCNLFKFLWIYFYDDFYEYKFATGLITLQRKFLWMCHFWVYFGFWKLPKKMRQTFFLNFCLPILKGDCTSNSLFQPTQTLHLAPWQMRKVPKKKPHQKKVNCMQPVSPTPSTEPRRGTLPGTCRSWAAAPRTGSRGAAGSPCPGRQPRRCWGRRV